MALKVMTWLKMFAFDELFVIICYYIRLVVIGETGDLDLARLVSQSGQQVGVVAPEVEEEAGG